MRATTKLLRFSFSPSDDVSAYNLSQQSSVSFFSALFVCCVCIILIIVYIFVFIILYEKYRLLEEERDDVVYWYSIQ